MREKDNKFPTDDIDTFGFTEEELEMLGQLAGEMLERETRAYEERIQNTPELRDLEPDEKILAMLRQKDRERAAARRRKKIDKAVRIAAIFLISIVMVGAIGMGTSEAFRIKVFSFFSNDGDGSVTIRSEETQLLAGWEDYWYPEYMPEGFELVGAEQDDMGKYMLFESDNSDENINIIMSKEDNFVIEQNTEETTIEEVEIGYHKGYIATDDLYDICILVWQTDEHLIEVQSENFSNKEELLKIAESMKYIK